MAERRMFTKKITDSDAFTALPPTTQALYFHLCMNADDDGFNNKIRQAMFNAHADSNDYNLLVQQKFIIPFDNKGVIVIKHWRLHNYIKNDRYHQTEYVEEKARLVLKENGVYSENIGDVSILDTERIQSVSNMDTEVRLGKDSIGKVSIGESKERTPKHKYGEYKNVFLTDEELEKLKSEYSDYEKKIDNLSNYIASTGKSYKSHYATIRNWARRDKENLKKGNGMETPDDEFSKVADYFMGG